MSKKEKVSARISHPSSSSSSLGGGESGEDLDPGFCTTPIPVTDLSGGAGVNSPKVNMEAWERLWSRHQLKHFAGMAEKEHDSQILEEKLVSIRSNCSSQVSVEEGRFCVQESELAGIHRLHQESYLHNSTDNSLQIPIPETDPGQSFLVV